jgi:hypothetical protein
MSSTIIDDIRNNAHSLCENRRPVYLLSVDVDQEYSSGLSQEFLTATQNFMDTIRPHAQFSLTVKLEIIIEIKKLHPTHPKTMMLFFLTYKFMPLIGLWGKNIFRRLRSLH